MIIEGAKIVYQIFNILARYLEPSVRSTICRSMYMKHHKASVINGTNERIRSKYIQCEIDAYVFNLNKLETFILSSPRIDGSVVTSTSNFRQISIDIEILSKFHTPSMSLSIRRCRAIWKRRAGAGGVRSLPAASRGMGAGRVRVMVRRLLAIAMHQGMVASDREW